MTSILGVQIPGVVDVLNLVVGADGQWEKWLSFKKKSGEGAAWLYFISFGDEIHAWGTASGKGHRLRYMGLFHDDVKGKYDRRIDYLMLREIFSKKTSMKILRFRRKDDALAAELLMKRKVDQKACYSGLMGSRQEITDQIFAMFQKTEGWRILSVKHQNLFSDFVRSELPKKNRVFEGRSWHSGDVLEPGGLERFNLSHFHEAIEAALKIKVGRREITKAVTSKDQGLPAINEWLEKEAVTILARWKKEVSGDPFAGMRLDFSPAQLNDLLEKALEKRAKNLEKSVLNLVETLHANSVPVQTINECISIGARFVTSIEYSIEDGTVGRLRKTLHKLKQKVEGSDNQRFRNALVSDEALLEYLVENKINEARNFLKRLTAKAVG